MRTISYGLFTLFLIMTTTAQANYLETRLLANKDLSDEAFLEAFSYEELLKVPNEKTTKYYEELERLLNDYQRPAAPFFLQLAEQQVSSDPIDYKKQQELLRQLEFGQFLVQRAAREFQIASDVVFEHLAEHIEQGFKQGELDPSDTTILYLVDALKAQEYGVSIPVSDLQKGIHHLKKGNLQYIWSRLWFDHPMLCVCLLYTSPSPRDRG